MEATLNLTAEQLTSLDANAVNFGFNIPTGSTINGIVVDIQRRSGNSPEVAHFSRFAIPLVQRIVSSQSLQILNGQIYDMAMEILAKECPVKKVNWQKEGF